VIELVVPKTIELGKPFEATFSAKERVAGRLRLTSGNELVPFTLSREGKEAVRDSTFRIRGKSGAWHISDWGEHEVGCELVLRFEGAKGWMTVVGS
jgi:hypothetical protein